MPRMLIISFVEWAGAFQRPQHMAVGFAREGWNVTYLSPGYIHRRGLRVASGVAPPPSLQIVDAPALPGAGRSQAIQLVNAALARRTLQNTAPDPWDTIIFNDPRWAALAASLPARRRIFDAMDDLSAYSGSAKALAFEEAALKTANLVWTGTAMMEDRLKGRHASVRFIPCGVEGDRFASPDAADVAARREEISRLFKGQTQAPLAGYFGALNERIDPSLIAAMLDSGWRVLLIGPSDTRLPPLPRGYRLALAGPRPYTDLPAWLACMDLALIPYRTDGANQFLYPVKALEYLAGGKPVLSSPLPDMIRLLGDYVTIADGAAEWRAFAQSWTHEGREAVQSRTSAGRDHALARSWETMIREMSSDL